MFRATGHFLSILALCALINGHLVLLQGVAWFRMTVDYSRNSSLGVALEQTFDGRHPCDLCKKISAAKKSDQTALRLNLLQDFKGIAASRPILKPAAPRDCESSRPASFSFVPEWILAPPTPPPRSINA